MTDVKALLEELRKSDPKFDEAQAVVDLVRSSGDMLEQMRLRRNWSQSDLAKHLGVSIGRVSQLESGILRNAPSLKMMARFAHACGEAVKFTALGAHATDPRIGDDEHVSLAHIMQEMIALREEVQLLRAAIHQPEQFAASPMSQVAPMALAATLQRKHMKRAVVEGALETARMDKPHQQNDPAILQLLIEADVESDKSAIPVLMPLEAFASIRSQVFAALEPVSTPKPQEAKAARARSRKRRARRHFRIETLKAED